MILYKNNAASILASGISDVATSLTVSTGDGDLFPAISGSDVFFVTLKSRVGTNMEIVKVTARSGDTLTIERGQEDTTAHAFLSDDKVELLITAGILEDLRDSSIKQPLASVTPSSNGELVFEATSNTTITVKYKGSDGTVRSGTITLS